MNIGAADIALSVLIVISTVAGLFRGLFKEAFSLAIWVGAFIVAYALAPAFEPHVVGMLPNASLAQPVSIVVLFIACLLVGGLLLRFGSALIASTGLSGTDRVLGMVFGALRGAVLSIVLLVAARPFVAETPWWQSSVIVPALMGFESTVMFGIHQVIGYFS